jgi:diguanylate cyclase (GGDEF)-like protein
VLSWFAIPVVTLSARFSIRGIVAGVAFTLALMLGIAFGAHAQPILDQPPLLVMPLALVLSVAILSTALMRSDVQHRSEAVIDPLTGMLNRKAMQNRANEIRQQSEITGATLAVVMVDIDHFKAVNDTVGHVTGDAVLRDVAYIMRRDLRAFELAYRLGGEEFLVMLPGTNQEEAMSIAERLREAIAENSFVGELEITVSCGVAASREGAGIDFQALLESADRALYEAKRTGRNRSVTARGLELVAA